ncbi:hypothetical protein E2C01_043845 [Portunus trituberculatus]|uniref:Uncharacterized protein n=1 Tax=Portunus trituberculatus TaxID=210409 RepID=A0A5B7FWS1_PORTR|nr:hypothetical protein [Portunus trituberculatus]
MSPQDEEQRSVCVCWDLLHSAGQQQCIGFSINVVPAVLPLLCTGPVGSRQQNFYALLAWRRDRSTIMVRPTGLSGGPCCFDDKSIPRPGWCCGVVVLRRTGEDSVWQLGQRWLPVLGWVCMRWDPDLGCLLVLLGRKRASRRDNNQHLSARQRPTLVPHSRAAAQLVQGG